MQEPQVEDWVERLSAAGATQEAALAELRRLLHQRLQSTLGKRDKVDEAFLEDVTQDALVAVLQALHSFEGRSKFTTWATTVAIRIAFTEMRRRRWKDTSLEQLLEEQPSGVEGAVAPEADTGVEQSRMIEALHRIMEEQLTDKQRTVLQAELAGMPQEEIGRRMGSNRNAVYKVAHDARKRLKKGLIAAGYSAEDLVAFRGGPR